MLAYANMKVFISWATDEGNVSAKVAEALHDWLPKVIQAVKPWMSKKDLTPGQRWNPQIQNELDKTTLGVFCVTEDGQLSQWMHFEAGALAKSVDEASYVVPLLINMSDGELKGPLQGFQALGTSKEDVNKLVSTINKALSSKGGDSLSADVLKDAFEKNWPDLAEVLNSLPKKVEQKSKPEENRAPPKTDSVIFEGVFNELLRLTRDTNSVINRVEKSQTQPLKVTTPFGPGLVTEYSSSTSEPGELFFSVEGGPSNVQSYVSSVQRLSDSQGFDLQEFRPRLEHSAISSVLPKIYLIFRGKNFPSEKLAEDCMVRISF